MQEKASYWAQVVIFSLIFTSFFSQADADSVFSLEANFMTERDTYEKDRARISYRQFLAVIDYGIDSKSSLSLILGEGGLETHLSEGETTWFDYGFLWGFGGKYKIYENVNHNYEVSMQARYLAFMPGEGETTGVMHHAYSSGGVVNIDYSEWQVSAYLSKEFSSFTLYGGIRYSDINCEQERAFSDYVEETEFEAVDNFGLLGGINIPLQRNVNLNFEVKFLEQTAFALGLGYKF